MNSKTVLKEYFGFDSYRPGQEDIINAIIDNNNVIAVLPTGGGKSLCYQIPALMDEGFSIVVSPLIALMKDQVDSLNKHGRISAFINSTINYRDTEEIFANITSGKIKLLYLAPEKLENIGFAEKIKNSSPKYLFIDEAHCISEWGHNFRPSYRKIIEFSKYISVEKISAFTATATPEVLKDIIELLELKDPKIFVKGFERSNITVGVIKNKRKRDDCLRLLTQYGSPAIVYTSSRKKAEDISDFLNLYRLNSAAYHAGLAPEVRRHIQEQFLNDEIKIIVATNAFGMGIDKKDIRLIIHYNMPGSIENYYQEIGRAGRDGLESYAFMLYDDTDKNIHQYFIKSAYPDKELVEQIYNALCDYGKIAVGSYTDREIPVNIKFISAYANQEVSKAILASAVGVLENGGYLAASSEFEKASYFRFNLEPSRLKVYIKSISNYGIREVILQLLREFGSSVFTTKKNISTHQLAEKFGVSEEYLDNILHMLDNNGIAEYHKPTADKSIRLLKPRVNDQNLILDFDGIQKANLNSLQKLEKMIDYVFSSDCRMNFIVNYFGEEVSKYHCGKCDNCTEINEMLNLSDEYLFELGLRTVFSSQESISISDVVNILKGSVSSRKNFSIYPTYGTCPHFTKDELTSVMEKLINKGYLEKTGKTWNKLNITSSGKQYLNSKISENPAPGIKVSVQTKKGTYEENLELYNKLREIRNTAASKFIQSSYLICSDEILRIISETKPVTAEELLFIKGFNLRMFNKIGNEFLEVIKEHVNKNERIAKNVTKESLPSNISETYELLKSGYSLKDIASLRKLTEAVISMQIETILEFYPEIEISPLFKGTDLKTIQTEIEKGYINFKDLKSRLPEEISYPLIRIAAAKFKEKLN